MRPRRWLPVFAVLSLVFPSAAAAQAAPTDAWRAPPRVMFIVAPLTAFPDPIAASLAVNPRTGVALEAGGTVVAPGGFVRAGLAFPLSRGPRDGMDLLAYAGYRAVVLPRKEPLVGPAAGFGIRRWVRGGWGLQLNTGVWVTDEYVDCVGACAPEGNRVILPEVRLAGVRSR